MTDNKKIYDVVIIGGGASGMMAGCIAAENGANVRILEKNRRLGEKLRISGGGRCNILNAEYDTRILLDNYGDSSKFLYSAFNKFGVKETTDFFADLGIKIKVEAKNRAFPISDDANDVVDALQRRLEKLSVSIITDAEVGRINYQDGKVISVLTNSQEFTAKQFIFASGGASRPETGSTSDGFEWLEDLGHSVSEPTPTITPLGVKEKWVRNVNGNVIRDAKVTVLFNGKKHHKMRGDILITHFGVSGPTILNSAYKVAEIIGKGVVTLRIDACPDLNEQQLDQKIIRTFEEHKSKRIKNVLRYIAPEGYRQIAEERLFGRFDLETRISEVSKLQRKELVDLIKNTQLTVTKLMGFEKAVVADGGVTLAEINMRTMQSTKISNAFILGDLLNIRRPTGGYSLQLCWTTGYIAGEHVASIV